jgi:hypothetical protein
LAGAFECFPERDRKNRYAAEVPSVASKRPQRYAGNFINSDRWQMSCH